MSGSLIRGKHVITRVVDRHTVERIDDGAVYQRDGIVQETGPFEALQRKHPDAEVLGSPGHVVLPGFVNGHHHVGLTPLQLGSPDYALELWFAARFGARRPDLYLDTLYSAFEMIESGITTVQHIHGWIPGATRELVAAATQVLRAYDEIGMRVSYCFAMRDQNRLVYEEDTAFTARLPERLRPAMRDYFAGLTQPIDVFFEMFDELRSSHAGRDRARIQLAPANLHWCSDPLLERLRDTSAEHDVPMHMHLVETLYQKEYARRRTGGTAFQHLHELGLTGPRLTLGHGVWLSEADIELAAGTGTCICHNCSSNLRLRSGVAALNEFERHGLKVAIGLDEAGINDDRDMLQEMRMVLRQHRVPGMGEEVPTCPQVLRMATADGAATTGFGATIGELVPGKAADLVAVDWRDVAFPYLDQDIDVIDAVIQRAKVRGVRTVMIAGKVVYDHGRFTLVDRDAALSELHATLARPDTAAEAERRTLGRAIFPHVKAFYDGYTDGQRPDPFYRVSSRA